MKASQLFKDREETPQIATLRAIKRAITNKRRHIPSHKKLIAIDYYMLHTTTMLHIIFTPHFIPISVRICNHLLDQLNVRALFT